MTATKGLSGAVKVARVKWSRALIFPLISERENFVGAVMECVTNFAAIRGRKIEIHAWESLEVAKLIKDFTEGF